jgi:hypothetical protein
MYGWNREISALSLDARFTEDTYIKKDLHKTGTGDLAGPGQQRPFADEN